MKLQVDVRLNAYMDAAEIAAFGADEVIMATGSLPPETGFQKALAHLDELPGIANGNVFSAEAVMAREARPGKRVIVLDEAGNWKGAGTAWRLAEDGHQVTIVTPAAFVGSELQRTAADFPLRRRLAALGVQFVTESGILEWTGKAAKVTSFLDNAESWFEADALVLATTNAANDAEHQELEAMGVAAKLIGDAAAPRQAPYAIHEGRKAALSLA
jgi:NAD(P)H-nitrite reductase large subunit